MNQRALLLVNRHARRGEADLSRAIDRLRELDFELVEVPIESSGQISEVIRQHKDAVDLVIVGGGDGTLNAAIDGLIETQLPLGILPLGTCQRPGSYASICQRH
jgi:diacylglycerol kinase family enzyme